MKTLRIGVTGFCFAILLSTYAADNAALNGDFESDLSGWVGYLVVTVNNQPSVAQKDSLLMRETKDTANGSKGSLHGILQFEPSETVTSHNSGIVANLRRQCAANSVLKVGFHAKSLSGSKFLSATRMGGGGKWCVVELKPTWEKYAVEMPVQVAGQQILFCTVVSKEAHTLAANGEFLLDDVSVEIIPSKSAP
jgi:hypothetical protein